MIAVDCVKVTPYVGVWIETYGLRNAIDYGTVTPYVGVWIETCIHPSGLKAHRGSHPTWVCGLKHYLFALPVQGQGHTLRGCVD